MFPSVPPSTILALLLSFGAQEEEPRKYVWRDGDRLRYATLVEDGDPSIDDPSGRLPSRDAVPGADDGASTAARAASSVEAPQPLFRSETGELMTLAGGILLRLREGVEAFEFFSANGIAPERIEPLSLLPNLFHVRAGRGLEPLELAAALAERDGVVWSVPNWVMRTEVAK